MSNRLPKQGDRVKIISSDNEDWKVVCVDPVILKVFVKNSNGTIIEVPYTMVEVIE